MFLNIEFSQICVTNSLVMSLFSLIQVFNIYCDFRLLLRWFDFKILPILFNFLELHLWAQQRKTSRNSRRFIFWPSNLESSLRKGKGRWEYCLEKVSTLLIGTFFAEGLWRWIAVIIQRTRERKVWSAAISWSSLSPSFIFTCPLWSPLRVLRWFWQFFSVSLTPLRSLVPPTPSPNTSLSISLSLLLRMPHGTRSACVWCHSFNYFSDFWKLLWQHWIALSLLATMRTLNAVHVHTFLLKSFFNVRKISWGAWFRRNSEKEVDLDSGERRVGMKAVIWFRMIRLLAWHFWCHTRVGQAILHLWWGGKLKISIAPHFWLQVEYIAMLQQ